MSRLGTIWKRFVANRKLKYIVATLIFLFILCFYSDDNIFTLLKSLKEVRQQEKEKHYYRKAIKETEDNLLELTSNKDSLERFAREQYFFHEDDEDIFVIDDSK